MKNYQASRTFIYTFIAEDDEKAWDYAQTIRTKEMLEEAHTDIARIPDNVSESTNVMSSFWRATVEGLFDGAKIRKDPVR